MRHLRNVLYFVVGFMLAANVVIANATTLIFNNEGQIVGSVARFPVSGTFGNYTYAPSTGGGGVTATTSGTVPVKGGKVPVNLPVTVKQKIPAPALVNLAVGALTGGVPGMAVGAATALMTALKVECDLGGCRRTGGGEDPYGGLESMPAEYNYPPLRAPTSWRVRSKPYGTYNVGSDPAALCGQYEFPTGVFSYTWNGSGFFCHGKTSGTQSTIDIGIICPAGWNAYSGLNGVDYSSNPGICAPSQKQYFCPSDGGWVLDGQTCRRTPCSDNEYRDQYGTCQPAGLSASQLSQLAADVESTTAGQEAIAANGPALASDASAANVPIPVDPSQAQVIGPASVSSPPQSSTRTENGQTFTTTTTTTINNTYNGGTVTTNVTNNYVTKNEAGETVAQGSEEVEPEVEENVQVSDSPMPDIPVLYERKYPDGLVGVWNDRRAELMATPLFALVDVFVPQVSAGACPSWVVNVDIPGIANYGAADIAPPCWLWPVLKIIIVVSALFLARSLIFGG